MSQYFLSVLCHFVALADCIRSGYVGGQFGGQFVITRNIIIINLEVATSAVMKLIAPTRSTRFLPNLTLD